MLKLEEVDWNKAKVVVSQRMPKWYEEYDEAEGLFMGWRRINSHTPVSFSEFAKWLNRNGLEDRVR